MRFAVVTEYSVALDFERVACSVATARARWRRIGDTPSLGLLVVGVAGYVSGSELVQEIGEIIPVLWKRTARRGLAAVRNCRPRHLERSQRLVLNMP